jgi:hypothetical protein
MDQPVAPGYPIHLTVTHRGTGMAQYTVTPRPGDTLAFLKRKAKEQYLAGDPDSDPADYGVSWQYATQEIRRGDQTDYVVGPRDVSLVRIRDLKQDRDEQIRNEVAAARAIGHSWTEIGDALGVTKQAAQQRYGS